MATVPDDGSCKHGGLLVQEVPSTLAHLIMHYASAGAQDEKGNSSGTLMECVKIVNEYPDVVCPPAVKLLKSFAISSFLQVRLRLAKTQYCKAVFLEGCIKHGTKELVEAIQRKEAPAAPCVMELLKTLQASSSEEGLLAALKREAPCQCLKDVKIKIADDDGTNMSNEEFLNKVLPEATRGAGSKAGANIAKAQDMSGCSNPSCKAQISSSELKRCGACKKTQYCKKECQLAHWKNGHKQECAGKITA
ncbi:hypothetical protein CYMTET_24389 [Cymbomonas tetramitiformis]|uniref:MYND-type domain-containing protein n=1 Tax=Cymbomonas tetramitiformis TaxID=36881 RepID=A0AAE0KZZ7_9CHLO|nr:hypothetical protein CYMTET_24389 [Cymbomonas tetramitiformis]